MLSMDILERLEQRLDEAQSAFSSARQALRVEFVQALNKNGDSKVSTNEEMSPSTFMIKTGQNLRKSFFQQFGRNIDIEDLHQLLQAALEQLPEERDANARIMTEKSSQLQIPLEDEKEREATRRATEDRQQAAVAEFHCRVAEEFQKIMGRSITEEEHQAWIEQVGNMRFIDAEFPSDGESDDSDFNPEAEIEQEQLLSDMREDEEEAEHDPVEDCDYPVGYVPSFATKGTRPQQHREIITKFMQTEFGSDEDDSDYRPESDDMGTGSETSEFSGQDEDTNDDENQNVEYGNPKEAEVDEEENLQSQAQEGGNESAC